MEKYLSLSGECVTEKVIDKSRFITTSRHIEGEQQAKAFIAEVSSKYPDATHNCYAYIADDLGNFLRFSDDGEPQGTAGMPMLEVLKNKGLYQTAVVVTRYFGGIKLGAGGLVRAYSGCTAENLNSAQKVLYELCCENEYTVDYTHIDSVQRYFAESKANLLSTDYTDAVKFVVAVKSSEEEEFVSKLINRLNGQVTVKKLKQYYFPFKI